VGYAVSDRYPHPILWTTKGTRSRRLRSDRWRHPVRSDPEAACPRVDGGVDSIPRSSSSGDLAPLLETSSSSSRTAAATYFSVEDDFEERFGSTFCTLDVDNLFDAWEKRPWYADRLAGKRY